MNKLTMGTAAALIAASTSAMAAGGQSDPNNNDGKYYTDTIQNLELQVEHWKDTAAQIQRQEWQDEQFITDLIGAIMEIDAARGTRNLNNRITDAVNIANSY